MKYNILSSRFTMLKGRVATALNIKFKLIQRLASAVIPPEPPLLQLVFSHMQLIDQWDVGSISTTPVTLTGINGFDLTIVNTATEGLTKITIDQDILDLVKTYMPEAVLQDLDICIEGYAKYLATGTPYTSSNKSYYTNFDNTGITYQFNECDIKGYYYYNGTYKNYAYNTKISVYIPIYVYV